MRVKVKASDMLETNRDQWRDKAMSEMTEVGHVFKDCPESSHQAHSLWAAAQQSNRLPTPLGSSKLDHTSSLSLT